MKNLKLAISIAIKGRNDKNHHLGCLAKRSDGSYVSAFNSKAISRSPSVHAEAKALKKAGVNSTLWVARVLANGSWGMAKPCEACQKLIKKYKVKKVYYTISNNELGIWRP